MMPGVLDDMWEVIPVKEEVAKLLDYNWTGPKDHPHLGADKRAAQFLPFAALTGYDKAVQESGRLTIKRPILTEEERGRINDYLMELALDIDPANRKGPLVQVTWYKKDQKKSGGSIEVTRGELLKIDSYQECLRIRRARDASLMEGASMEGSSTMEDSSSKLEEIPDAVYIYTEDVLDVVRAED